jgi:hypothetical protein
VVSVDENTLEDILAPTVNPHNPSPLLFTKSRSHRIMDSLIVLLIPSIQATRGAWQRCECQENMQRLTLALLLYEKEHGSLPDGDWREALKTADGRQQTAADFRCPSCHELAENETTYAMIRRESGETPTTPNTLLLSEVHPPMKLGEGDGTILEAMAKLGINRQNNERQFLEGLGSYHSGGMNAGYRSGAVRFETTTTKPEVLQQLLDGSAMPE